jgi:glutathione S-transferase
MRAKQIEFEEVQIRLFQPDSLERKLAYSPAGKVPVLIANGVHVWESLAILDRLAELFPDRQLWPADDAARAVARSVSAEMHAGFQALRTEMPMNCRATLPGRGRGPGVADEIERVCALWQDCRTRFGQGGHFLFGEFGNADAMFAPVVSRFHTYGVQLSGTEAQYAEAVLSHPAVAEWIEAAAVEPWTVEQYELA